MRIDESSPVLYLVIAGLALVIIGGVVLANASELLALLRGLAAP